MSLKIKKSFPLCLLEIKMGYLLHKYIRSKLRKTHI